MSLFSGKRHKKKIQKLYVLLDRKIPLTEKFSLEADLVKTLLKINYKLSSIEEQTVDITLQLSYSANFYYQSLPFSQSTL